MNNHALTAMTGGVTRSYSPPVINSDSGKISPSRPIAASPTPSVNVSLSEEVTGRDSKGQILTEKFESTTRELFSESLGASQATEDDLVNNETGLTHLPPLSLPTKADVEAFEKMFTKALETAGVDTSIPIKLNNDGEGGVIVTNDHPDKDKIEALFKENPDLQQGFVKTEIYNTLQKLYQLHQQWLDKVESGMSEEAANTWLIGASKTAVANSEITFSDGKVVQPSIKEGLSNI